MENTIRWFFSLVLAALMIYSCASFRSAQMKLTAARDLLAELHQEREELRAENELLTERIGLEMSAEKTG